MLPNDAQKAKKLFQRAVDLTNKPDGHYGLAGLYLEEVPGITTSYDPISKRPRWVDIPLACSIWESLTYKDMANILHWNEFFICTQQSAICI